MRCRNCGSENRNTNIRCDFCSADLISEYNNVDQNFQKIFLGNKTTKRIYNIVLVLLLIPWLFIGLTFIGVSAYSKVSDFIKSKNYITANATLVGYSDCERRDEEELCSAIYEYEVDGITYKASSSLISNKSNFSQIDKVKYNPENPKEYSMNKGWNSLLIVGIVMVTVVIIIFISTQRKWTSLSLRAKEDNFRL